MKKLALAAVLSIAFAGAASAADLAARPYTKAPAPFVAAYNWTGFYIGLNAGYHDIGTGNYAAVATDATTAAFWNTACFAAGLCVPVNNNSRNGGFIGGGQIGYNWQAGTAVFGLEADIQGSTAEATSRLFVTQSPPLPAATTYTSQATTKMDWLATFRARAGILVTPQTLLYVTGGGAVADVNRSWFQQYNNGAPIGFAAGSQSSTNWGWTVGAGVEWAAFGNWTVGAEYLFVRIEGDSFRGAAAGGTSTPANSNFAVAAGDFDNHIARVKLNYKFGGPVVAKY